MAKIVLVHTGKEFLPYINDNITQLKKYGHEIHLITNLIHHQHVTHDTCKENFVLYDAEPFMDIQYRDYMKEKKFDASFRDDFFSRATSRFFILRAYADQTDSRKFWHIESDVLLYSKLEHETELLWNGLGDMAVVIDAPARCIPSMVYMRHSRVLNQLCDFIMKNIGQNDMENLFHFFALNKSTVLNLPILPEYNLELDGGLIDYANCFRNYNSIFDGAAIGQYLGGIDPRNKPGNTKGFVNETTIFKADQFTYDWRAAEGQKFWEPFMMVNGEFIKINNLHIHSKNLKEFMEVHSDPK